MELLSNIMGDNTQYTNMMELFIVLTTMMFLPFMVFMMTSFVRIVVTFSFLKSALGAQQSIPSQILVGLSIVLTLFIMKPVLDDIAKNSLEPYSKGEITMQEASEVAQKPIREFLLEQTRTKDLELFIEMSNVEESKVTRENIPLSILAPAFATSELKTAFQIGFLIYIPFIIVDLVVASILMSMGMFMLPPVMVSLPLKLLLFVMVDGWTLLIKSLVLGF